MMKIAILASMLVLTAAVSPALAGNAFQGVDWGATEQQVREAFPASTLRPCNDATAKFDKRVDFVTCGEPMVDDYVVAGVPFDLRFEFDKVHRKLKGVHLTYMVLDGTRSTNEGFSTAAATELRKLLTERYGAPTAAEGPTSTSSSWTSFATWDTPSTSVSLHLMGSAGAEGDSPYTLNLLYSPAGLSADAAKL